MFKICPICENQNTCQAGVDLAEQKIIPFVKRELLKLPYPEHPFPRRYESLANSCYALGQVLHYHENIPYDVVYYYTDNPVFHRFTNQLGREFGIIIKYTHEVPVEHHEVCEFNVKLNCKFEN